jgi:hypothetical protein
MGSARKYTLTAPMNHQQQSARGKLVLPAQDLSQELQHFRHCFLIVVF